MTEETTGGVAWSLLGQVVTQGIRLLLLVILARLLEPEPFGLVAMVAVFTGFAWIFVDAGFGAALIQRPTVTRQHAASAFWVSTVAGLILTGLLVSLAPLIASLYGQPILTSLVIASAPVFLFAGAGSAPKALLQRAMAFRRIAQAQIVSAVVGGAIGVTLAAGGAGPWSLVAMTVATTATTTVGYWIAYDGPIVGPFDRDATRDLWRYGRNVVGFGVVNYWARQGDDLLIGWRIGAEALGLYTRAYSVLLFPITQVSLVLGSVMFPAMSRIQHDTARVRSTYLTAVRQISVITFPATVGLTLVAPEFVYVVFGPRWVDMVPLVQVLGLVGAVQSVGVTIGWLFQALDETRLMLRYSVVSTLFLVTSFLVGLPYGVVGVAIAYATATTVSTPAGVYFAGRKASITPAAFAAAVAPAAITTAAMSLLVIMGSLLMNGLSPAAELAATAVIGASAYVGFSWVIMPSTVHAVAAAARAAIRELKSVGD